MTIPIFFWRRWRRLIRPLIVSLGFLLFYLSCLNHVEPATIGLARNLASGEISIQEAGWHCSPPWVKVARVDTRPMRVSVDSAGHGYNAKLVQFDTANWQDFIQTEGFYYYWWANRFSFNFGYDEEHRGLKDILRGYAYSAKKYSFIKVLDEYQ